MVILHGKAAARYRLVKFGRWPFRLSRLAYSSAQWCIVRTEISARVFEMSNTGQSRAIPALAPSSLFTHNAPSDQEIVDIFHGEWSSNVPDVNVTPGHAGLFDDARIHWMNEVFNLSGKSILELGPLEAAHTVMMERLGAKSIVAVEGNQRAFLKCLCIKEIFDLKRSKILLGDFGKFLDHPNPNRFDIAVASGVLYHMTKPLRLLEQLISISDRVFLWTHYYEPSIINKRDDRDLFERPETSKFGTHKYEIVQKNYSEEALTWQGFSGGNAPYTVWMTKAAILDFFQNSGFATQVSFDQLDHPNGPAFCVCASK